MGGRLPTALTPARSRMISSVRLGRMPRTGSLQAVEPCRNGLSLHVTCECCESDQSDPDHLVTVESPAGGVGFRGKRNASCSTSWLLCGGT